ncbi:uncharacterized protein [Zea mays]|uniref:uncharacterized protein n=1 Tax=Zea mays TaxID=4577 RepID=UPI0004DE9068|nr:uncharacterized protein LOC103650972 [Zea mays]|eukprot:XP_008674790.1 uncharacterized protein LOC103650972 [Zea mays]
MPQMEVPTNQIPAGWFTEPASEQPMGLPRTGSSSRLNAQAPEFVPRGPPPPTPAVVLPPPPQRICCQGATGAGAGSGDAPARRGEDGAGVCGQFGRLARAMHQ